MTQKVYIQAATAKPCSRRPVWMMRQAGRYLPEYRAIREKHSFLEMIKTPDLATEITLQPIRRYGMDAAILFSDILVIPEALGSNLEFVDSIGPVIHNPIRSTQDIDNLKTADVAERYAYVLDAITSLKAELEPTQTPLIGFCGAPFTLASYMIEGRSSQNLKETKRWMGHQPDQFLNLLNQISDVLVAYLSDQIRAGVDAIQIFDTWAGLLSWDDFENYSYHFLRSIISRLDNPNNVPVSFFCKSSSLYTPLLTQLDLNVISLDWTANLSHMRTLIPETIAIQGNLDPLALFDAPDILERKVRTILKKMEGRDGFIFNLGHGILPKTPLDNVQRVVDIVKETPLLDQ